MIKNNIIKSILLSIIGTYIVYLMRKKEDIEGINNNKYILCFATLFIISILYQMCNKSKVSESIKNDIVGGGACPF